jgi:hypothetical protein
MGPLYDQTVAYESGQEVGSATGTIENVVLLAAGIEGGVNGARALLQTLRQSSALTFTGEGALAVEGLAGTSVAIDQIGQGGTAAGLGIWNLFGRNSNNFSSSSDGIGRNPADDKPLTDYEIEQLKKNGYDIHCYKGKKNASKRDLFKDKKGNVYIKPKSGVGPGEEFGVNINDLPVK